MMRPVGRAARRPPLSCIGRQARQARSGYSGAASPRGIGNWMPANADFNQLLGMDSGRMRARVRDLVRNFPPFARAVNAMVAFTVGSGARFQSLATLPDGSPDIPTRKRIEDRFRAWMEHADVAGRLHFYEIQQLCKRQECECGEYLLRFARPRDRRRGLLGLQIYEPENLSSWRIEGQEPDSDIWQGIEYDIWTGEPLAYHFQTVFGWERQLRTWREPAFNVLHGFQTLRPGQLRGVTPFAPAILMARDMGDYTTAELGAAKMAAKWLAFVSSGDPQFSQLTRTPGGLSGALREEVESLEDMTVEYLNDGEQLTSSPA